MTVKMAELYFDKNKEDLCIVDITHDVKESLKDSKLRNGIATIFVGCSTASIGTMKHDREHIKKMEKLLEKIAPSKNEYMHHKTCGDYHGNGADTNGKSHMRSAMFGPGISLPFMDGKLAIEDHNSIVLLDFDLIKRKRKVIVQVMGN